MRHIVSTVFGTLHDAVVDGQRTVAATCADGHVCIALA